MYLIIALICSLLAVGSLQSVEKQQQIKQIISSPQEMKKVHEEAAKAFSKEDFLKQKYTAEALQKVYEAHGMECYKLYATKIAGKEAAAKIKYDEKIKEAEKNRMSDVEKEKFIKEFKENYEYYRNRSLQGFLIGFYPMISPDAINVACGYPGTPYAGMHSIVDKHVELADLMHSYESTLNRMIESHAAAWKAEQDEIEKKATFKAEATMKEIATLEKL